MDNGKLFLICSGRGQGGQAETDNYVVYWAVFRTGGGDVVLHGGCGSGWADSGGLFDDRGMGAIVVEPELQRTFYARLKPISPNYQPSALDVCGFTREETLQFEEPLLVMERFRDWIQEHSRGRPIFVSDNNGFD